MPAAYLVSSAMFVTPAVLVGTFLFVASRYKSIERRLLIGAAIVVGNGLVFGGVATYVFFGGYRAGSMEVRNEASHPVVVNVGSANKRVEPGATAGFLESPSIDNIVVVTDTTPLMMVELHLHDGLSGLDHVVVLTDAETQ